MNPNLPEVITRFQFDGEFLDGRPYGCGHINDTFAAYFQKGNGVIHRYILQRINHNVFKDVQGLMQNIAAVTTHLQTKIVGAGGDPNRETLTLIPTTGGQILHRTPDGYFWRAYAFIEGARTYERVENLDHVYHAAHAFANFQRLLADLPTEELHITIPYFHHTRKRFGALIEAVEQDVQNRAIAVRPEIEFVENRVNDTTVLLELLAQGKLSECVTHNDTKFNNVMIDDATGRGICVIDLDTVMPGLPSYDFGDAVRSAANTSAEDEQDLSKVYFDLEVFEHFVRGYLDGSRDLLTSLEIEYLPFSAKLMALECGMRFLTDHLSGDVYFRIHRENHNLDRCRTQFRLVSDIEEKLDQMLSIVLSHRQR